MKKIYTILISLILIIILNSCTNREKLLFLNWGEYIDEELLEEFEGMYNCDVYMDLGDSNEIFYSKIIGGTTVYDVVCPSDYMVEKLYKRDKLAKIDMTLLPSFNKDNLVSGVINLRNQMEEEYPGISDYFIPYLWGTWGIMYSTKVNNLEKSILSNENQWDCLFNRNTLPSDIKLAMYNSHLHAYYAACKYLGLDTKKELNDDELELIHDIVKSVNFDVWGTDNIKKDIVKENIDLGFMWTGDFLYYYCETAAEEAIDALINNDVNIEELSEMIDILTSQTRIYSSNNNKYEIGFDIFIPEDTIAFCDNLIIPKDAQNKELAHKFIDFMCTKSSSYKNTYYVCYNTPFIDVYDQIIMNGLTSLNNDDLNTFNYEIKSGIDKYSTTLYNKVYDYAISIAFDKYYNKNSIIGNKLYPFDRKYINTINKTFNNART